MLHRLLHGARAQWPADVRPAFPLFVKAVYPSLTGLRVVVPVGDVPAFGATLAMRRTAEVIRPSADELSIRYANNGTLLLTAAGPPTASVHLQCSWNDLRTAVEADPYVSAPSAASLRFDAEPALRLPPAERAALSGLLRRIALFVEPGPLNWLFAWHEWLLRGRHEDKPRLPDSLVSDLTDEAFGLQPAQLRAFGIEGAPRQRKTAGRNLNSDQDNSSSALRPEPTQLPGRGRHMDKISPSMARARLRRVRLSPSDHEVLGALLAELGEQVELPVERAQRVLFAGRTPAAATKAVERLVKLVNTAAAEDGVDLRLEVRGAKKSGARGRLIGFSAERVEPAGDPLREHEAVRDAFIEDRQATLLGHRRIVLCHALRDAELAGRLWDLLTQALDGDPSRFEVWRLDLDILAGDDADLEFRTAVAGGELVIVALSNAWLGQPELGEVVRGQVETAGLRVVPVLLRSFSPHAAVPEFLGTIYPQGKPFAALRGEPARDQWVNGLVDQVHQVLAHSGGAVSAIRAASSPDMGLRARRALSAEGGDGYYPLHGRPDSMEPDTRPEHQPDGRRVDVVSFLLNWARDPDSTPLAALLGEYGAGKTITCQELTERLRRERAGDQPEPLYFDLRGVGNLDRGVPTLADILTECIQRGWASADAPLPTGAEVIADARTRPTLFIIDGLDEVLVRLDAAQGVTFTRELLKLRPIRTRQGIRAPFAGEHTKVLLSCRTHYFRSLREQSRHFLEQDRDLTRARGYISLVLLPLTQEQIHVYFSRALPDRDATQVLDMLRAVHDLSDLATRPYTLAKVAALVPFIERRHTERRPVHAATIYRQVLRDWLARDRGKHRLRPDHKLTLMARLAAWSWRRGDRRVDSTDLDDWLDEQLATGQVLSRRYRDSSRDQLEEDLRTATFVIRSDDNGPDRPDFRFAHSSIHEYFLAQYLYEALRDGRRQDWCLPIPSPGTLDFLGQLITDDDDPHTLTAELGRWRAPYLAQASELWLRYTLRARDHGWPHPR